METINREHPEYGRKAAMWKKYRHLYAGGEVLRENAAEYLVRRHKEPLDIYAERVNRAFYENYAGSIVDWYAATLMRREPAVLFEGHDEPGKAFYNGFFEDCDLKGTDFTEFLRQRFVQALVYGRSYLVVDFPRVERPAANRAEEDALGRSRAYLVDYSPEEVINWSHDPKGGLDWVVIRTSCLSPGKVTDTATERETRWIYYDRANYRVYRRVSERGEIELVDEGRHGLAALGRTPLFELRVSDGLWLMNKGALLQLEHFNKSNALAWALTMGLFAMPVIFSDKEFKQVVGESYYIQLGKEDRFGWTEPGGNVYQIAADNLVRLKDEIYRVCYLMNQAGSPAGGVGQSGLSKLRDFSVTQEVLRAYGDAVKETLKQVLRAIVAARQDALAVDVSGLDEFDIGNFSTELEDAQKLLELGIGSETLKKQVHKKLALKYLCDVRQELKNAIAREIDGE
jgi:hypothetical protein